MSRAFDVIAQALDGGAIEARQHHVLSPGQLVELARGECGTVKALQVSADFQTLYLQCDNCTIGIRVADKFGEAALRALMSATVNLPPNEVRPGMISERFRLGEDGRPTRIVTDPSPDRKG